MNSLLPPACFTPVWLRWKACAPREISTIPFVVVPRCLFAIDRKGKFLLPSFSPPLETREGTTWRLWSDHDPIYPFRSTFSYPFSKTFPVQMKTISRCKENRRGTRLIKKIVIALFVYFERGAWNLNTLRNEFFHSIRVIKVVKSIRLRRNEAKLGERGN